MIPVHHPQATLRLIAPPDWDTARFGEFAPLAVAELEHKGVAYMVSLWEPLPEELELIKKGGKIILAVQGDRHPLVSLGVNDPTE